MESQSGGLGARITRMEDRAGPGEGGLEYGLVAGVGIRNGQGKLLSSKTKRSTNRAANLLRMAAVGVGKTSTALGAFYRRLGARVGKAKAITATARKIATLFYNMLRYGKAYVDPGAAYYEQRHTQQVIKNLRRRAKALGLELTKVSPTAVQEVS
jgi:transposase